MHKILTSALANNGRLILKDIYLDVEGTGAISRRLAVTRRLKHSHSDVIK